MNRRSWLQIFGSAITAGPFSRSAQAASDFWNRKEATQWSGEEVALLLSHSPWAKEVNAEFVSDADYTVGGNSGPSIGAGGRINAPTTAPQVEMGTAARDPNAGAKRRQPVTVLWESAEPVRSATGRTLAAEFAGHYVVSISGLPLGVMERRRRTSARDDAPPEDQTPAARQHRMLEQLSGAATLSAKGQEPEQAGVVQPMSRTPGTYLFGFSKELLPLDAHSHEIVFTLETALMAVKAKFDPKTMIYKGKLAV